MSRIDIEDVMNDINTQMVTNINTYIDALNVAKGDTLLAPFVPEAYFLWNLPTNSPPYAIFICQYLNDDPKIIPINHEIAIRYSIRFTVFFRNQQFTHKEMILKERYNRIIRDMVNDLFMNKYQCAITSIDSTLLPGESISYEIASIEIKLDIIE